MSLTLSSPIPLSQEGYLCKMGTVQAPETNLLSTEPPSQSQPSTTSARLAHPLAAAQPQGSARVKGKHRGKIRTWKRLSWPPGQGLATLRGQILEHAGQPLGHTAETRHLQRHMPGQWELPGDSQTMVCHVYAVGSSNTDILGHSIIFFSLPTLKLPSRQ